MAHITRIFKRHQNKIFHRDSPRYSSYCRSLLFTISDTELQRYFLQVLAIFFWQNNFFPKSFVSAFSRGQPYSAHSLTECIHITFMSDMMRNLHPLSHWLKQKKQQFHRIFSLLESHRCSVENKKESKLDI